MPIDLTIPYIGNEKSSPIEPKKMDERELSVAIKKIEKIIDENIELEKNFKTDNGYSSK